MHYVECGPEPEQLGRLRNLREDWDTAAKGPLYKPFMAYFSEKFNHLCGYCERVCTEESDRQADDHNTVDHFRPKGNSRYRRLAFEWDNLVYACYRCGQEKGEQFPGWLSKDQNPAKAMVDAQKAGKRFVEPSEVDGYVNPRDPEEKAETFFVFNSDGKILPNPNLDNRKWSKAWRTIRDLDLNTERLGLNDEKSICNLRRNDSGNLELAALLASSSRTRKARKLAARIDVLEPGFPSFRAWENAVNQN